LKSPYVSELAPNQEITAIFLVQFKEVRQKRTGEPYLILNLIDKTGGLDAKMWDNAAPVVDTFERDDFIRVRGLVQIFQNRPQLTVHRLKRVEDHEVDLADFLPASKRDPAEMFRELAGIVGAIGNPYLRALLAAFFADDEIARLYRTAPAAKAVHHAYIGGLIEHVLSMAQLARMTAAHYSNIDLDLLLAGVILHDVGKIRELCYDRTFGYTTEGQLLGHIYIAMRMLSEKIRAVPGFPPKLRMLLEHMILSHHGALEFGSPKVPLFAEALLLHLIDNMDSKMETLRHGLDGDDRVEGEWTGYISPLDRSLLKKDRFLDPAPSIPQPALAPVAADISVVADVSVVTDAPAANTLGEQLAKAWNVVSSVQTTD
jgi:3'-5' exoribonuclease